MNFGLSSTIYGYARYTQVFLFIIMQTWFLQVWFVQEHMNFLYMSLFLACFPFLREGYSLVDLFSLLEGGPGHIMNLYACFL